MLTRRALLIGSGSALVALPARAGGLTVHLCGDSLFHGFALGRRASEVGPEDPLHEFRSLSSMAALVFEENAMPISFVFANISFEHWQESLEDYVARFVSAGDWVLFEEAGPHIMNMAGFRQRLLDAHGIVLAAGARPVFSTMFDYPPAASAARYDPEPNATTRQVASETGSLLLDFNAAMDTWRAGAWKMDRVAVMHADGVHGNVWGQMLMLRVIFWGLGLRRMIRSVKTVEAIASKNYRLLRYGGNDWSSAKAARYCRFLLTQF